ncbi:MAG: FAD-dependent oxidoreductase [Calditrichaeota bacterium]|nr:FAD-dependent oxidoreductase [Calditrichota bacterium]
MSAGIYTARSNLKTVIIEKGPPGGQLHNTAEIENYCGFTTIMGPELAEKMEAHARSLEIEFVRDTVTKIIDGKEKIVQTESGTEYRAKAVIVSAGGHPRYIEKPGEKEYWGKGVSYCATCDGFFYRNKDIAVIGGGDSAFEEGNYLTKFGKKVTLIHRRDDFRAQAILQDRYKNAGNTEILTNKVVKEIAGTETEGVRKVVLEDVKTGVISELAADGVFIFVGFIPNNHVFPEGVEFDESGAAITDHKCETKIPGIFAIGDVRKQFTRQVATAVGDGATAGVAASQYIDELD